MNSGDQPEQSDAPAPAASAENTTPEQPASPTPAVTTETASAPETSAEPSAPKPAVARGVGPLASRGLGIAKPGSPTASPEGVAKAAETDNKKKTKSQKAPLPNVGGGQGKPKRKTVPSGVIKVPGADTGPKKPKAKVAVPNLREDLPSDIQAELEAELSLSDIDELLGGAAGMADRKEPLEEGARVHAQVLKIHNDTVFISLGGPDEGTIPFEQFTEAEPAPGDSIEVLVRGMNSADGLYALALPGAAISVTDFSDIEEGSVVEATVTGHNAGGLECKVGGIPGFMPISQVTEYRVEDLSEFVEQKFVCLVMEANEGRGNLVLSRRAILEREREVKRKEQLEQIEPGMTMDGIVRKVLDFGAFVDLGGVDGLIHVSKLSWDRIKHPSEVMEEGQKVKVKIDSIDKETGKISLSYRDLLVNPWDTAEADFEVGSIHKGTVTRIADFGCFVRLTAGVEGLVHISELAHHRVSRVNTVVTEGEDVSVKILSFDRDSQKIGLSMKATTAAPESESSGKEEEEIEPQREPAIKATHSGPLRGGNDRPSGGEKFGLRW